MLLKIDRDGVDLHEKGIWKGWTYIMDDMDKMSQPLIAYTIIDARLN